MGRICPDRPWLNQFVGTANAGRIAILTAGVSYQALPCSVQAKCDYCARVQVRPESGGCVGCGAALPAGYQGFFTNRVPSLPRDWITK